MNKGVHISVGKIYVAIINLLGIPNLFVRGG